MKLTSRVFSALKDIGGSFVAVEDGVVSTVSQNGTVADCNGSELAEDAVLKVGSEQSPKETNISVSSVPTVQLNTADITPILVLAHTNKDSFQDNIAQRCPARVCSQDGTDLAFSSVSSGDRTAEELICDKWNDDDGDNIVFSSGTRRKVRRIKQPKGKILIVHLTIHK